MSVHPLPPIRCTAWIAAALLAGCASSPPELPPPSEASRAVAYEDGVPGGVVVDTLEVHARVVAVDHAERTAVLLDAEGVEHAIRVGPEAVNFDQVEVGDQVDAVLIRQLIIGMAEEGAEPSAAEADLVALAPPGAAPGGVMARSVGVTGVVTAIDPEARTATLRFPDGETRTLPVRPDIDLAEHHVGEAYTFQVTEGVAIDVVER